VACCGVAGQSLRWNERARARARARVCVRVCGELKKQKMAVVMERIAWMATRDRTQDGAILTVKGRLVSLEVGFHPCLLGRPRQQGQRPPPRLRRLPLPPRPLHFPG
jgi:hypothetical protein